MKNSTRMDAVQAPIVPVIGEWIRQTPETISLGQGVVRYGPPRSAIVAARQALDDPAMSQYHDGAGTPALLERIAAKLERENGMPLDAERRVMVTAGANMAFVHAIAAVTHPGDEIILPVPFYFNHEMAIQMAGCRVVAVPTDNRYHLSVDALRAAVSNRTRAIVTISPNNPSGAVFSEASLRAVNALCGERGLYHVTDETYEYFVYEQARHAPPGSFSGAAAHTISIFSLSKAYGLAGWRVGYVVYPRHLESGMMKSQDTLLICPTILSQVIAAAALDVGRTYCDPFVAELEEVRHLVLDALAGLGSLCDEPSAEGAFYVLLRVHTTLDSLTLAERLIREHRVAVVPGPAFGMTEGCSFRIAYGALQKSTVEEGIGRFVGGLRRILAD